jgi:flagellin-like hook-associated protein FlgL
MNHKTIPGPAYKIKAFEPGTETSGLEFLKFTNRETNLKNLDQAIHNVSLGMEMLSVLDNASSELENILSQVKQWISLALASNFEDAQVATLAVKISLKLGELDQVAESCKYNGQKLLNGSLSVAINADAHSYLVVGTNGSPENRINLNTSLNIPPINSKTLGLRALSIHSPKNGLKGLMVPENALGILNRLKQRSTALGSHLQEIQLHLSTTIENHHAADMAPDFYEQARELLKVASNFIKKNKGE